MKYFTTLYWALTGVTATFMMSGALADSLQIPQAISTFGHLGYPKYLLPFLGKAKTLAVVTILVPGFPRLKEWAFAGLVFDASGALYSHLSVGDPPTACMPAAIAVLLLTSSYLLYRIDLAHRGESDSAGRCGTSGFTSAASASTRSGVRADDRQSS